MKIRNIVYLTSKLFYFYFLWIIVIIIFSVFIFRYFSKYEPCHFEKVFKKATFPWKHLFSSFWRDQTRFCSFSLLETEKNLKNFIQIDKKYFENEEIKFMFESLDYFIKNKENYYKKEEIELLKNIKNDLKLWEKDKDTVYNFFYLKQWLQDSELCFYKKSENKGYCIVNHM